MTEQHAKYTVYFESQTLRLQNASERSLSEIADNLDRTVLTLLNLVTTHRGLCF